MDMETFSENSKREICTLIFMDLETTGLPGFVGKRNVHITELSLVAVDRNSFDIDKNLRIQNKLTVCVRPRSLISPSAMDITGLYNDMLSSQEEFNDSIPKLLEYFFRRLKPPICLLAHNGNKFDFPVLQAELKRINYALDDKILCADTLVAVRDICRSTKTSVLQPEITENRDTQLLNADDEEFEEILSNDIESFCNIPLDTDATEIHSEKVYPKVKSDKDETHNSVISHRKKGGEVDIENKSTTLHCLELLPPNEKTPTSRTSATNNNAKKRKIPKESEFFQEESKKKLLSVKRNLFPGEVQKPDIGKITKFSLESLYNHFFNEPMPHSHQAETDCLHLSKICQQISTNFLKWIDEKSIPFSSVPAMW